MKLRNRRKQEEAGALAPTPAEHGKSLRKQVPRAAHREWEPDPQRPDPLAILEAQGAERVQRLVPIRYGRMLASAGAFYRGGAGIMAWDLSRTPSSGLRVQCCGDAHLLNFGLYASLDRRMVFDLNDFDETLPAPFEWDLKRLVASVSVAARDNGCDAKESHAAALAAAERYRSRMAELAAMPFLDVWYSRTDAESIVEEIARSSSKKGVKEVQKMINKAGRKTNLGALARYAERTPDGWVIKEEPPVITAVVSGQRRDVETLVAAAFENYLGSLGPAERVVIERYHRVDFARKIVGVGSVGTQAFMLLMMGAHDEDPLFIQFKEASQSVLAPYAGASIYKHQGERVVRGQQIMQSASDPFLGWTTDVMGQGKHYYLRQLRDMKGSVPVEALDPYLLSRYAELCGSTLAHSHARSGDAAAISAYIGSGDVFPQSIAEFAELYAEQNQLDYEALQQAVADGRIEASLGV
jgi:uncharacterized protein (DUF2252 family)